MYPSMCAGKPKAGAKKNARKARTAQTIPSAGSTGRAFGAAFAKIGLVGAKHQETNLRALRAKGAQLCQ